MLLLMISCWGSNTWPWPEKFVKRHTDTLNPSEETYQYVNHPLTFLSELVSEWAFTMAPFVIWMDE